MFESVQCSNKLCSSQFDENAGVQVPSSIDEHVWVCLMLEQWCSSLFDVWWNGVRPITSCDKQGLFLLALSQKIGFMCNRLEWNLGVTKVDIRGWK